MTRLPPQVLIASQEGVDAYLERTKDQKADLYGNREIDWLGRLREVSIGGNPARFPPHPADRSFACDKKLFGCRLYCFATGAR